MPKEMINVTVTRQQGEPWGLVIVGGKDQSLTVKLGRIKAYSAAEKAGLKEWDYVWNINGQEVFEMTHNQICQIWPSNKDKSDKYKRRLIGMEYYMDAMENHGLKGHLPQPDNFTTCGKLGIEINQYNCPIEVTPFMN